MNYNRIIKKKLRKNNDVDMKIILRLRDELCNYNIVDFLTKVSALMLFPQNQSKSIIFQCMISTALSIPNENINFSCKMSSSKFKYFIREFSNLNRKKMIDPPEFPFYLPVMYYGNYNVFMGASSLSPIYLNQMLKILRDNHDNISENKYKELDYIVSGLLKLSEDIVKKINLKFDNLKSYDKDIEIFVPSSQVLNNYCGFVQFNEEQMNSFFYKYYSNLLLDFGAISIDKILDSKFQKFYKKSLIKHNNMYLITDVTTIIGLVMNMIIDAFRDNKNFNIFNEYNNLLSVELDVSFTKMAMNRLNPNIFKLNLIDNLVVQEAIYLNGNDIVFYNIVLFYDEENCNNQKYIFNRIKYVKNKLIKYGVDKNKIVIIITPTIGEMNILNERIFKTENNLLILAPYELHAIAVNETNDSMFLFRYIRARNLLYKYRKNLFSELNTISMYASNNYSFYVNDNYDMKEDLLCLVGDYSSDYILKSYIKECGHLSKYKDSGILVEVIKTSNNIYYAPGLFLKKQLNTVIEFDTFNLWILSEESLTSTTYLVTKNIMDMIAYWLSQFNDLFNKLSGIFYINIKCDIDLSIMSYKKNCEDNKIEFNIEKNNLNIHFAKDSLTNFNAKDNLKEKEFILIIINNICDYFGINIESKYIAEIFNNKYKQKIITINSLNESYMLPFENPETIRVNTSDINLILDDVGNYVKNVLRINYGKIEDYKIINNIVEYLFDNLQKRIKIYDKEELLKFLYLEYEKNFSLLYIRESSYRNDLACYPNRKKEIEENYNSLHKNSVAMKFLIELAASTKFCGIKRVSIYDIEYCLSIAYQIIEYAYVCDAFNYKIAENSLVLYKSNRIGYNYDLFKRVSASLQKAKIIKMSPESINKRNEIFKYDKSLREEIPGFEEAFQDEFGFKLESFMKVVALMLEMAENKNPLLDDVFDLEFEEIIKYIKNELCEQEIKKVISYLSLEERENYLEPSKQYRKEDVYPWRNNRELSLNRKPLIVFKNRIIFGYRTLSNSVYFLFNLIDNAMLKTHGKKMENYISKISKNIGDGFNDLVYNYLCSFNHLIVDKNISKINGKKIVDDNNNDLGDIDIIYISTSKRTITIGEVKNFVLSKNMYEIYTEYLKMFDTSNKKSFYNKHMRRVEWCKRNINDIINHYHLKQTIWKIDYCFIVNNQLISNKAMKINVKAYTIDELDKHI